MSEQQNLPEALEKEILNYSTSESVEQEVPKLFCRGYIALWLIAAACLIETIYKYVPNH